MKYPEDLVCTKCEKTYTDYKPDNPNKPLLCKDCRPKYQPNNGLNLVAKEVDKQLTVLAREVYNGDLGEGEELKNAVKSRGYNLRAVKLEIERLYGKSETETKGYQVTIKVKVLDVRKGPGIDYTIVRSLIRDTDIHIISEEAFDNYKPKRLWGKLESGLGWILLEDTTKV